MQFHNAGRQFFFITIAVEGREPVLSRLVDEKSRPALLPCGEAVKAVLCALHGEFPCATVSDFVIMPDHVHILLIADYSQDPAFSPLWVAHRVMDATEMLGSIRERTGTLPPNLREAAAQALAAAIAAAHRNQGHLTTQGGVRGQRPRPFPHRGFGGSAPVPSPALRWNRHCYIELSFDAPQLKAIRHYIRLNPARALWKLRHPDRFARFANIRHAILDPARRWDAMGNLTLLGSPFLRHVRLTMRKTVEEHSVEIAEIVAAAERGVVLVSGFISAGEKELLRRLKATPHTRFVKTVPFALPPRYDPSAEDSRELAADRLLILSGFPQGTPDTRKDLRARCNIMNDLAKALCEKAKERG